MVSMTTCEEICCQTLTDFETANGTKAISVAPSTPVEDLTLLPPLTPIPQSSMGFRRRMGRMGETSRAVLKTVELLNL